MGKRHQSNRNRQRQLRRKRGEKAFIFDAEFSSCLGEVDREDWEFAISVCGGSVAEAANQCGLPAVPKSAKALWGRSAEEALGTYRRWQKKKTGMR